MEKKKRNIRRIELRKSKRKKEKKVNRNTKRLEKGNKKN